MLFAYCLSLLNPLLKTPPRQWGRLAGGVIAEAEKRNTPTCVGKTHLKWDASDSVPKHPHGSVGKKATIIDGVDGDQKHPNKHGASPVNVAAEITLIASFPAKR